MSERTIVPYALLWGGLVLAAGALIAFAPRAASAKSEYFKQTGLACVACHDAGYSKDDPKLTKVGKDFQANGHKVVMPK